MDAMSPRIELPLELLPEVLRHLPKVHYLTSTALVSRAFHQSTIPQLYARASIYSWHKDAKWKVVQLFRTLSSCPHLARYVHRLEIRDFPRLALPEEMVEYFPRGLRNCTSLRSCTWTRDGSLTSDILLALSRPSLSDETLSTCSTSGPAYTLRELEINGHHTQLYDPKLLLGFKWLTKISIIMPTGAVVRVLEEWVEILQESLRSLNVICKMSPVVTDDVLIRMAPYIKNLEIFHLTGCPKVTHRGLSAVLSSNYRGIHSLGLESVSPRLNLTQLVKTTNLSHIPPFENLRSLTLSIPPLHISPITTLTEQTILLPSISALDLIPPTTQTSPTLEAYTSTLLHILTHHTPKLEIFQIYSPHMFFEPCRATSNLFQGLVRTHGNRLKRISVHRMLIGLSVIREICRTCSVMEEFFIVVEPGGLDDLADCLHDAKALQTVHVNYPLEAQSEDGSVPVLRLYDALNFIKRCNNPNITQFGCNSRVWHVKRKVTAKDDGELESEIYLGPYESPDIPEAFLVVRT